MIYKIKKGRHYSNFMPSFKCLKDLVYSESFIFTDSCKYDIDEKSCVNKLFGFCFGFGVHKNSIRFGWTYNRELDLIEIWSYVYLDGKLTKNIIFSCKTNETHYYEILINQISKDEYNVFLIIDSEVRKRQYFNVNKFFITSLGPYFGGKTRAPHDIEIKYNTL